VQLPLYKFQAGDGGNIDVDLDKQRNAIILRWADLSILDEEIVQKIIR
jgi:hypothetical protein